MLYEELRVFELQGELLANVYKNAELSAIIIAMKTLRNSSGDSCVFE
jgi:hypothetical protein